MGQAKTIMSYRSVDHLQNLGLDQLQVLGISRGGSADHIVDSGIVIFSAKPT